MSFISYQFYLFFPIVTALYFALPHRFRWAWLLFASCIFYMAFIPAYIFVLLALIAVDYTTALLIEESRGWARWYLVLASIISLCGALLVFKYFNFVNGNVAALAQFLHWQYGIGALSLALPLGLSFHTFQSLSYVIEVYKGKQKAERNFGIYALYVMFYPQLVAGPIERPQQMLPQFYEVHTFDYERAKAGLIRMAWGFFKKMVVADHLGLAVTQVYGHPQMYPGISLIVASVFFSLQLYFDFSGYCDIALGAAQVMGFTLVENFKQPFSSRSMSEWWHRWHISLSSWFRDYVYYPLVLSKRITPVRLYAAVLCTFLITGFWHGANWTFGAWGLLHGFYLVFSLVTQKPRKWFRDISGLSRAPRTHHVLQVATTFTCAAFAAIFFRSTSIAEAWYIITHLLGGTTHLWNPAYLKAALLSNGLFAKAAAALPLGLLVLWAESRAAEGGLASLFARMPTAVRWAAYYALVAGIIFFNTGAGPGFIYFQF